MILGPSYTLTTRRASVQRSVGWMPRALEAGNEKGGFYLEQCPGLRTLVNMGAEIRGGWWTGSRLFVVAGDILYEVNSGWGLTTRGTLSTSTGRVDMAQGLLALVIVDGAYGYVLTLASNAFAQITDADFHGADRVGFLDGRFIFTRVGTQQFFWSEGIDTASSYDALDFSSAESAPDDLVALVIDHRELWLFGEYTTEVWFPAPSADQIYQRNNGAVLEAGCIGAHTAQKLDNSLYWLGRDTNGAGMVFTAGGQSGYQPVRVSTHAVEEALSQSTDLSAARAFTYQQNGQSFYCLKAPGVPSVWFFDVSAPGWHQRCDVVAGELAAWRGECHVYGHGKNLIGGSDGVLYWLDPAYNKHGTDVMPRVRTSPHNATPSRNRVFFSSVRLDMTVGSAPSGVEPVIEMRHSDDGGYTWGAWLARSTGEIGRYDTQVQWDRLGSARDRVWEFRVTDDCNASIVGAAVSAQEGAS